MISLLPTFFNNPRSRKISHLELKSRSSLIMIASEQSSPSALSSNSILSRISSAARTKSPTKASPSIEFTYSVVVITVCGASTAGAPPASAFPRFPSSPSPPLGSAIFSVALPIATADVVDGSVAVASTDKHSPFASVTLAVTGHRVASVFAYLRLPITSVVDLHARKNPNQRVRCQSRARSSLIPRVERRLF